MNFIPNPGKIDRIKVENVSRRGVLKGLGIVGGLVLAAPVMSRQAMAAYATGADKMPHGTVVDPRVFVAIASDGTVTIVAHRSEMGTGIRTSLPMIVADELEADWSKVRIVQAPGDEIKYGKEDHGGLGQHGHAEEAVGIGMADTEDQAPVDDALGHPQNSDSAHEPQQVGAIGRAVAVKLDITHFMPRCRRLF